jgi:hypothetical protein
MKRLLAALALVIALAQPAHAAYRLPVDAGVVKGAFWVTPPLHGHWGCPMCSDVHADAPGVCPNCSMDLERAPTQVKLTLGAGVSGRAVRLGVKGKPSFTHAAKFDVHGNALGAFPLPPGTYTFTAELVAPDGHRVNLAAPYTVR